MLGRVVGLVFSAGIEFPPDFDKTQGTQCEGYFSALFRGFFVQGRHFPDLPKVWSKARFVSPPKIIFPSRCGPREDIMEEKKAAWPLFGV